MKKFTVIELLFRIPTIALLLYFVAIFFWKSEFVLILTVLLGMLGLEAALFFVVRFGWIDLQKEWGPDYIADRYDYGLTENGLPARQHKKTGVIEFMLWKPGEQGHKDGYWHKVGDGHTFQPYYGTLKKL